MSKENVEELRSRLTSYLEELKPEEGAATFSDYVDSSGSKLEKNVFPNSNGVYAFWWIGGKKSFLNGLNKELIKSGPDNREIMIEVTEELLKANGEQSICLYIGKTSRPLQTRIGRHLRLRKRRDHSPNKNIFSEPPASTDCQLKRGMEELFLKEEDIRELICRNVAVTYVVLDGDINCMNRFYLENLAIGTYLPIINLDVER